MLNLNVQTQFFAAFAAIFSALLFVGASIAPAANNAAIAFI